MTTSLASVGLPQKKYNVELEKKGRAHFYRVTSLEGKNIGLFPGVTGYLSVINRPALIPWATKEALKSVSDTLADHLGQQLTVSKDWIDAMILEAKARPNQIKTEAADLGTMAHGVFDRIVKGETIELKDVPEIIRSPVSNFLSWFSKTGIQMVMGDTKIASVTDKFGGSLDGLGWIPNRGYCIIDFKTSGGIWPEYALQVAAYSHGFESTYGKPIAEAYIVRFDKKVPEWNPEKDVKKVSNLTVSYAAFKAAKELKDLMDNYEHFDC